MKETTETDYKALMSKALVEIRGLKTKLKAVESAKSEPVAIIGVGCRLPGGADTPEAFWELLSKGGDGIVEVPEERWDIDAYFDPDPETPGKMYCRSGGFLRQVDRFDSSFFAITPRELVTMDPQQRLLLEVAWEALESAGQPAGELFKTRTGVFTGISSFDYAAAQFMTTATDTINAYMGTGIALSAAAGRLSYVLGLTGPSMAIDTACSSSLVAVHLACQSLRNRECAMALAGGVNVILSPELSINFSRARMLAPDGRCKTFDASADGYVRGEGCGVVVLKRLSEALAAGDRIMAVIRGSAVNQDGPSGGLTVPSGPSQEEVIRQALASGGVQPAEVSYVEAHGTGTSLGDPIEVGALGKVFAERPPAEPLMIGSVKTNIGHLEAAAGISGLIKVVLSLQQGEIPPHLHFRVPNPHIDWQSLAIEVAQGGRAWPAGRRKIAGVSSFGFTGTNAHIVLEEGPIVERKPNDPERPCHILALSAKSAEALQELAGRYAEHLATHPDEALADVCATANRGRTHFEERLAVAGASGAEIVAGCRAYQEGRSDERVVTADQRNVSPKLAFIFPGALPAAASPAVGLGQTLYETAPLFRRVIDRCTGLLPGQSGQSLLAALSPATAKPEPAAGNLGQAALFALECGLFELWRSWGIEPAQVLGQGAGEVAAACAAGVFTLDEGLKLIMADGSLPDKRAVAEAIDFQRPTVGIVSPVSGALSNEEMTRADYWLQEASEPPGFAAGLLTLQAQGAGILVELGPATLPPGPGRMHLPSLGQGVDDWQLLLKSLGTLYVQGLTVDWQGFDQGYGRSKISLPTYPFQRQRYWLAGVTAKGPQPRRPSGAPVHPLLGQRVATAHRDQIFESLLASDSPSFLGHHRIYGVTVFPATGFVEMALAAGAELLGTEALVLEGFTIDQPLILPEEGGINVQTVLSGASDGGYAFAIHSEQAKGQWTLHASGRLGRDHGDLGAERLTELRARCPEELSVASHYREFAERGIAYGNDFQGLQELRQGKAEALGLLKAPLGVQAGLPAYLLHPALFDAGLQAAGVLLPAGAGEGYFPVGISKLRLASRLPGSFRSHGRLRGNQQRGTGQELDFTLYDEEGVAIVQVEGLAVKRATRETLLRGIAGAEGESRNSAVRPPAPPATSRSQAGEAEGQTEIGRQLTLATPAERGKLLQGYILEATRRVMGHSDAALLKADRPLMDQGLDSLMAVELRNLLAEGLAIPLAVGLIFDYPSVDDLCRHLAETLRISLTGDEAGQSSASQAEEDDGFAYLDELDPESLEELIKKDLL